MSHVSFLQHAVLAAVAGAMLFAGAPSASGRAAPSPGTIRFRGHLSLGPVDGELRRWMLTRFVIDEQHPERSQVDAEIDVASLDTANATRDRHLRGSDFLDVERFPIARVRVRDVQLDGRDAFTAQVELELHGVTRSFPMHFSVADREARQIRGQTTLNRTDYGVGSKRGGLLRVYDPVDVEVDAVVPAPNATVEGSNSNEGATEDRPEPNRAVGAGG